MTTRAAHPEGGGIKTQGALVQLKFSACPIRAAFVSTDATVFAPARRISG